MSKPVSHIFDLSDPEITERRSPSLSFLRSRYMDLAGPLFEVGGRMICRSRNPDYKGGLHRQSGYHRFVLMVHGRMEFRMNKKTFIAEPGDLVCTPAGTLTQRTALEPIEWIYLDIEDRPLWTPLKKTGPTIRKYESADLMVVLVSKIIGAMRSQDIYSIRCAHESAGMLVTLLERELKQYDNNWKSERLNDFVELFDRIRENPSQVWNRAVLAQEAGMSERNLTKIFKKLFDTSPGKMIIRIRMEHAMALLVGSQDTVEKIGKAIGYESPVSFSNAFRNYAGITPGAYRKQANEG